MTILKSSLIVVFFQAEDGIRDLTVTGVQTCALPISQAQLQPLAGHLDLGLAVAQPAQRDAARTGTHRQHLRLAVDHQQRLVQPHCARQGDRLGPAGRARQDCRQQHHRSPAVDHRAQSLKLLKANGTSATSLRSKAMAACRSSRLVPVMRTASPWMAACTFSLLSLTMPTIFLAVSLSMPCLTCTLWRTLSPPIFSILALKSRKRMSTPRLVSLLVRMSRTWATWKSLSACNCSVRSLPASVLSILAAEPLKSKRVPISLLL